MTHRTRRPQLQLSTLFENPERMVRPKQAVVAPPASDETNRPTGREENTMKLEELITRLSEKAFDQRDSDRWSLKE